MCSLYALLYSYKYVLQDLIEGPLASDPLDVKAAEVFKSDQVLFNPLKSELVVTMLNIAQNIFLYLRLDNLYCYLRYFLTFGNECKLCTSIRSI